MLVLFLRHHNLCCSWTVIAEAQPTGGSSGCTQGRTFTQETVFHVVPIFTLLTCFKLRVSIIYFFDSFLTQFA